MYFFLDLSKDVLCLEALFHMKARIYNLFEKNSDAIKVLKKLKKAHIKDVDEELLHYLIGHLYEESTNFKEALNWYKRVLNISSSPAFSMTSFEVIDVYLALFAIARIKFNQKNFVVAKLVLDEFCSAYNNHEEELNHDHYQLRNTWEPVIGDMNERMTKAQEMLVDIMKMDDIEDNEDQDPSEDIIKTIKILETHRRQHKERDEAQIAYHYMHHSKDFTHAIIHYQTFFKDIKVSRDKDEIKGGSIEMFEKHFEDYCECLLRKAMFDEALEFLHSGLQQILTFYFCQWEAIIEMQYKILCKLARIYAVIGDYKKCDYYIKDHKKLRHEYKFLKGSPVILVEEAAYISMNLLCSTKLSEGQAQKMGAAVTNYFNNGTRDLIFDERLLRFYSEIFALKILEVHEKVKQDYKFIPDAVFAWHIITTWYDERKEVLTYPDDQLATDMKIVVALLLTYFYHLILIMWRKLERLFPEKHNLKEVIKKITLPDGNELFVSKFKMNGKKYAIDQDHQLALKILTEPANKYHEKVLRALRKLPECMNNQYLNSLSNIHPKNGTKLEKRKWRLFKNSAQTILSVKNMVHKDEIRVTDDYKDITLSTRKPDSFSYSDYRRRCNHSHH